MLDVEKFNIGHYKNLYKSIKLDIKFKNSLSQISSNLITPPPTLDLRPWLPPLIPDLKPWTPKEPEPQPLTCNCIWTVLLFMEYNAKKNCKYNKPLSRDFLHKNAIYDKPGKKGWTNIALMDSAVKYGTVPEEVYPHLTNLKMTPEMYKLALNFKIDSYIEFDYKSVNDMKIALTNYGPCVMEYSYDNITSTPWIPSGCIGPFTDVISIVGYTKDRFILRNNWGTDWGDNGYCYMPFADYTKYSLGAYYATFINNNIEPKLTKQLNNTSIILSSLIGSIILLYFISYIFYKKLYELPLYDIIFHYGKYASYLIFSGLLIITTIFIYNFNELNNVFIVNISVMGSL